MRAPTLRITDPSQIPPGYPPETTMILPGGAYFATGHKGMIPNPNRMPPTKPSTRPTTRKGRLATKGITTSLSKIKIEIPPNATDKDYSKILRDATRAVLLAPLPDAPEVTRLQGILETLTLRAYRGDNVASSILLDRFGGKVVPAEVEEERVGGSITIQWQGTPIPWVQEAMRENYGNTGDPIQVEALPPAGCVPPNDKT
jgi:hypothetical protein